MQEQASTDADILKARDRIRDDLLLGVAKAERIVRGEVSEEELMSMPFPGLREAPVR